MNKYELVSARLSNSNKSLIFCDNILKREIILYKQELIKYPRGNTIFYHYYDDRWYILECRSSYMRNVDRCTVLSVQDRKELKNKKILKELMSFFNA